SRAVQPPGTSPSLSSHRILGTALPKLLGTPDTWGSLVKAPQIRSPLLPTVTDISELPRVSSPTLRIHSVPSWLFAFHRMLVTSGSVAGQKFTPDISSDASPWASTQASSPYTWQPSALGNNSSWPDWYSPAPFSN